MASRSHHVACTTDDPARVHDLLTEVIGLPVHLQFRVSGADMAQTAGWPPSDGADVVMYGTPPGGLVEIIAIPEELLGRVPAGVWLVSFATPDLAASVAAARSRGMEATEPYDTDGEVALAASFLKVGGIDFELVRFAG